MSCDPTSTAIIGPLLHSLLFWSCWPQRFGGTWLVLLRCSFTHSSCSSCCSLFPDLNKTCSVLVDVWFGVLSEQGYTASPQALVRWQAVGNSSQTCITQLHSSSLPSGSWISGWISGIKVARRTRKSNVQVSYHKDTVLKSRLHSGHTLSFNSPEKEE